MTTDVEDEDLVLLGQIAARVFDRIIVKEDNDKGGLVIVFPEIVTRAISLINQRNFICNSKFCEAVVCIEPNTQYTGKI